MNYIVFPKQFPTLSDGTLIPCNDIKSDFKTVFNPLNTILEPFNDFYDKIIFRILVLRMTNLCSVTDSVLELRTTNLSYLFEYKECTLYEFLVMSL
jgi:hypothetical protein